MADTGERVAVAFHLLGVILWMGGLLALTRILGYHAREAPAVRPRLAYIEARLDALVALPGAVLTLATGGIQLGHLGRALFRVSTWLHWKLALVALLVVLHLAATVLRRRARIAAPDAKLPRGAYAAVHGTVGLAVIAVLLLAALRPVAAP